MSRRRRAGLGSSRVASAGLATALHGARAGLDVVVVEPRGGSIDKACGEGLMPHTMRQLERLGIAARGKPLRGVSYLDGYRQVSAPFGLAPGAAYAGPPCTPYSWTPRQRPVFGSSTRRLGRSPRQRWTMRPTTTRQDRRWQSTDADRRADVAAPYDQYSDQPIVPAG
jgi:hypothetical protein